MFGNWNAKFFLTIFDFFFHLWLPSVIILMIKVFAEWRIYFSRKCFQFGTSSLSWLKLYSGVIIYFILARKGPRSSVQSFFRPWQKANFPSMTIGTFFIETKILIILLHSSAVIAVIHGKLKIENSSMKANLGKCLYDNQLGLYLGPFGLYWLCIASVQ